MADTEIGGVRKRKGGTVDATRPLCHPHSLRSSTVDDLAKDPFAEDSDAIAVARVARFSPGKRKLEVASQVEHWKPESNRGARWGRAIRPRNSVFGSAVLVFEVPVRAVGASSVSSPAGWRSTPDFEVLAPFPFSFVCFRHRRCDAVNQRILDIVNASSEAFLIPGCE